MSKFSQLSGLPPVVEELVDQLSLFPGIGRKTAFRMALHVLRTDKKFAQSLSDTLIAVKDRVGICKTCWSLAEQNPCPICSDDRRDRTSICVVEESGDVIALERTGGWNGLYHVLGGAIAPLDGIGPEQLRLDELYHRIEANSVREVVVATNPTSEGETTALYIARMCKPLNVMITRIARGVPMGSDLELVDDSTLQQSLEGRTEIG